MSTDGGKKSSDEFQEWLAQIHAQIPPGAKVLTKEQEEDLLGYNEMTEIDSRASKLP